MWSRPFHNDFTVSRQSSDLCKKVRWHKNATKAMTIFWCCEIKSVYSGNLDNALFCRISMVVDVAGAVVRQRLHPLVEARSKEKTTKIFKSWVERILFGLICSPSPLDSDNMKLNYLHKWLLLLRSLYPHECSTTKKMRCLLMPIIWIGDRRMTTDWILFNFERAYIGI